MVGRPGARDVARVLPRALERLGFQARVNDGELSLSGCPCPIVAPERPKLICDLADAVTEGVLAGSRGGLCMTQVEHDPGRRRCRASLEPCPSVSRG